MQRLTIFISLILLPTAAHATTYYVAKTGSNTYTCGQAQSQSTAKQTISAGIACMAGGDTLIIGDGTYDEQVVSLERYVLAQRRTLALSEMRFRNGVDSYINVLTAQTGLYSAEQLLVAARLGRLVSLVDLYRAMGGGWIERTGDVPRAPTDLGSLATRG